MSEHRWEVYERCAPAIARFVARRVEPDAVEDVVAETFSIAWRKLPRDSDPLPWLYGVARKVVYGHHRGAKRRTRLVARVAGHQVSSAPAPSHLVVEDPQLARAFETLTTREREAICLIAWEGLSNEEAARAAGCSVGALAVRYSRARTRLTAALAERGAEAPRTEPVAHCSQSQPQPQPRPAR